MPLTRHLYKEDEVPAALMFCILNRRHVEAAFWCQELLDSGMSDELMAVLRRTWLYGVGVKGLGWLRAFQETFGGDTVDPDAVIKLVIGLCRIVKDRSILTLLTANLDIQPDRVNAGTVSDKYSPLEAFTALAILQRKTLCAWGGLRAMEKPDEFLRSMALSKHGPGARKFLTVLDGEAFSDWERRAAGCAALCLSREEFMASWRQEAAPELLKEVAEGLEEWEKLLGRRARRIYKIPPAALYWMTARGRDISVYDTNVKEMMGRVEKSSAIWGSVFWDSVAEEAGGWAAIKNDSEVREAFYEAYFPDDIPDEWSAAEREKSHGSGPLQRGVRADTMRALTNLFGRLSAAVIWAPLSPVKNTESWDDLWTDLGCISVSGWCLTPASGRSFVVNV
jgi:hypothetical protein